MSLKIKPEKCIGLPVKIRFIQEQWFLPLSLQSLKRQENLLLKNLQQKTRVDNVRFLSWRAFFEGKYGIQSINEMGFKKTETLRGFSISRHQIWCAHAIVVQRMHACARKMPFCCTERKMTNSNVGQYNIVHNWFLFTQTFLAVFISLWLFCFDWKIPGPRWILD